MPDRYVEYMPIDEVETAPRNPKGHDTNGISRSIGHFGFAELPLIDERTGRLVAGHGRHQQLLASSLDGKDAPDGVQVDSDGRWLMPVVRGWSSRSDDDAEAYLIASNQLTTKGGWDDRLLAEVLHDLGEAQMLDLTGYEAGDLESLEFLLHEDNWSSDDDNGPRGSGNDDPNDADFWPKIEMRVPTEVFDAWTAMLNGYSGAGDVDKLIAHLQETGHYQ